MTEDIIFEEIKTETITKPENIMAPAKSDVKIVYEKPDLSPLTEKMDKLADALLKPQENKAPTPNAMTDEKTAWDLMGELI